MLSDESTDERASQHRAVSRARAGARVAALLATTALTGGVASLGIVATVPVPVTALIACAAVATATCAGAWLALGRRPWFTSAARRWFAAELLLFALVFVSACTFLVPVGTWLLPLCGIAVLALAVVGAVAAGLWRIRRQPGLLPLSLLLAAAAVPVTAYVWSTDGSAGLRFRLLFLEDQYRAEAADLIAHPPNEPERRGDDELPEVVLGYGPHGEPSVAWVWVHGIPARSYGIVFDPEGVLPDENAWVRGTDVGYGWSGRGCTHIDGRWYWCRVY